MKSLRTNNDAVVNWLVFAYLVVFPFGQLARLPLKFANLPEVNIYAGDIIAGLLGILGIFGRLRKSGKLERLGKYFSFFSLIGLVSLVLSLRWLAVDQFFVSLMYWGRLVAYFGMFLAVYQHREEIGRKTLLKSIIGVGVICAIFGFIQLILWPDFKPLESLNWDPHYYRLTGAFLDSNFTGIILAITLLLIIGGDTNKTNKSHGTNGICRMAGGIAVFIAMILTQSRSSYLALVVGLGVLLCLKRKLWLMILAVGLLAGAILLLPKPAGEGGRIARTYSVSQRITNYQKAFYIIRRNPVIGVGFNSLRYAQRKYGLLSEKEYLQSHSAAGLDNSFLFVLATTGLLGGLGILGLCWETFNIIKKSPIILAVFIAVSVHSMFQNTFFYPWIMGMLALTLAFAIGMIDKEKD